MKVNLRQLKKTGIVDSLKGQKLLIYGGNSLGKTLVASQFDKALLLMTEMGGNAADCDKTPVTDWVAFKDMVKQLTSEKVDKDDEKHRKEWETMQDMYEVIIIDTLSDLVEMAEKQTCTEFGVRDLSEIEDTRKNGYSIYRKDFKDTVNRLCQFGYFVIFIDHEEYEDRTDAKGKKYQYMQPKGSGNKKGSTRFVRDICDFTVCVKSSGVDENYRLIPSYGICLETKDTFARSRYEEIRPTIPVFSKENLEKTLLDAIRDTAEKKKIGLMQWEKKDMDDKAEDLIGMIQPYFKATMKKFPDTVLEIVSDELGEGKKISECTDEDVTQLKNIYNKLSTFCSNQNITVE